MNLSDIFDNEESFFTPAWLRYYDNDIADTLSPLEALADQLTDEAADKLQQMVVDAKKDGGTTDVDINRWVVNYVAVYREAHKNDQLPTDLQPGPTDKVIAVVYGSPADVSNVASGVAEGLYVDRSFEEDEENDGPDGECDDPAEDSGEAEFESEGEGAGESIQSILNSHFKEARDLGVGITNGHVEAGFAQLLREGKEAIIDKKAERESALIPLKMWAAAANIDLDKLQEDLAADETLESRLLGLHTAAQNVDTPAPDAQFDVVQKAKHYNVHASGAECIEIVEQMTFAAGNAVKYIWRRGDKGNERQDIEKAIYYVNREVERMSQLLKFVPLYILRKYKSNNAFTLDLMDLCERVVEMESNPEVSQFYSRMFKQLEPREYKTELVKARNCLETLIDNLPKEEE